MQWGTPLIEATKRLRRSGGVSLIPWFCILYFVFKKNEKSFFLNWYWTLCHHSVARTRAGIDFERAGCVNQPGIYTVCLIWRATITQPWPNSMFSRWIPAETRLTEGPFWARILGTAITRDQRLYDRYVLPEPYLSNLSGIHGVSKSSFGGNFCDSIPAWNREVASGKKLCEWLGWTRPNELYCAPRSLWDHSLFENQDTGIGCSILEILWGSLNEKNDRVAGDWEWTGRIGRIRARSLRDCECKNNQKKSGKQKSENLKKEKESTKEMEVRSNLISTYAWERKVWSPIILSKIMV